MKKFTLAIFALFVTVGLAVDEYRQQDGSEAEAATYDLSTVRKLYERFFFCSYSNNTLNPAVKDCPLAAKDLKSFTRPTSTNCPRLKDCYCGAYITTMAPTLNVSNADACFTACSRNANCTAFSFYTGVCVLETSSMDSVNGDGSRYICNCQAYGLME